MKSLISPSILSADLLNLGQEIVRCQQSGADEIHIDIMDGRFVPNITFGPQIVKACRKVTSLPLDAHLMIVEPEKHLKSFIEAGAEYVTVHFETCAHIHRTLQTIRELGAHPGISFNPGTPIESLRYLSGAFDMVLIMSVNPGFGGQKFIPRMVQKINDTARMLVESGSEAIIQVDGGIDPETIRSAYEAGARNFVAGTAIFGHPQGIKAGIKSLRDQLPE